MNKAKVLEIQNKLSDIKRNAKKNETKSNEERVRLLTELKIAENENYNHEQTEMIEKIATEFTNSYHVQFPIPIRNSNGELFIVQAPLTRHEYYTKFGIKIAQEILMPGIYRRTKNLDDHIVAGVEFEKFDEDYLRKTIGEFIL